MEHLAKYQEQNQMTSSERLKKRSEYIKSRIENVPKHLKRKEILNISNELYISERTVYNDLESQ